MANSRRKVFYCRAKSIKGLSLLSWRQKWLISRRDLVWTKRKAIRGRVWFRVLERVERAMVDLAIRCVDSVRSVRLEEHARAKLTVLIPRYYIIEVVTKKHYVPLNQSEVVFGQRLATEPC